MAGRGQVQAVTGGERPVPGLMLHCLVVPRKTQMQEYAELPYILLAVRTRGPRGKKNSNPWGKNNKLKITINDKIKIQMGKRKEARRLTTTQAHAG